MEEAPKSGKNKLALFDFDGTLTLTDSMLAFMQFVNGKWALYWSLLVMSPILVLMKLGAYDAEKAKKALLKRHFKGMHADELKVWATRFCHDILPTMFRDEGLEKLAFHRSKGHAVYVVTASLDLWVEPWLRTQRIEGICTKAAWNEGVFEGEFASANCNGPEKARRILELVNLEDFERVYAYGDSSGDREMLALAHKAFYRRFL